MQISCGFLGELEKEARRMEVPIIRPAMQSLLKFLLTYTKPKSILEVGTAIGFSALLMSEYAPADCHITTIEKYEKRIPIARENFDKYGREDKITLLVGFPCFSKCLKNAILKSILCKVADAIYGNTI